MVKKISVVIPIGETRKMEAEKSLEKQKIPVEIIVVQGENVSRNRNIGIQKAKGNFIAFVNSHTTLPEDWSEKVLNFFERHKEIDVVGGPQLFPEDESEIGKISTYALTSPFGGASVRKRYAKGKRNFNANEKSLTSANLICRKEVCDKVKFDENLYPGEDPKFIADLKKKGFKVAYEPEIFVYNRRRDSIKELARQFFNYAINRPKKENFFETIKKPEFLVPTAFTIYLVVFIILTIFWNFFVFPLVAYVFLSLFFSLFESIKNKSLKSFFILPFIFFTIHIVYGTGLIWGYLKKWTSQ